MQAGIAGMKRQAMVVIPGLMTKVLAIAGELPPRRIALEINRLLWKPLAGRAAPRARSGRAGADPSDAGSSGKG